MNSFWTWLLGDQQTREGTPQLQWAGMPESWGVFVLIAIVAIIAAFVFWLYTREIDTCPRPVKILLACLRFVVLLLLVLMFLRSSVVFKQVNTIKPNIAVLRDASLSFARKDKYADEQVAEKLAAATGRKVEMITGGEATRGQLLYDAMTNGDNQILNQWREKGSLRIIDFSETVSTSGLMPAINPEAINDEAATVANVQLPTLIANGRGTDIWQGLREMLSNTGRLSAIILTSDGQHNGSEDPLELAYKARDLGIPIITVGVGDPSRPKNLSVSKLYVRDRVPVNEPFEIEAAMYVEDFDGSQIQVDLLEHPIAADGTQEAGVSIDSANLDVPSGGGRIRSSFQHTVRQPGTFAYSVRIAEEEGESDVKDNLYTSGQVEIVDQKVKVLLIAGAPTWEYRMLQRLFQRDTNIILSGWLQTMDTDRPQEGNERIAELPETLEELGQYNVIMMIDPDPAQFSEEWIANLKQFCRIKAGGLFYMAGPKHTNMFVTLNRLSGIRDILPVRFGDEEYIDTQQILSTASNSRPGKMLIVNHNLGHPIMSFVNDYEENLRLWNLMPSIYWSFPTLSAKPTALVLMERGDQINVEGNQPLLVTGRFGRGNVVYMGFNGTWRWRRVGLRAQYFDRFWIQVVNYLVETRSLQGKRRGMIDTDRNEYELGDKVTLSASVLNERMEELTVPTIPARIQSDEGRVQDIELKLLPGLSGQYESSFIVQNTGSFKITVALEGANDETGIEPVSYVVKPPSVESRAYWLDEKRLRDIADASGGKFFTIDQLDQIGDVLPQLESTTEYTSPPEPIWDVNDKLRYLTFFLPFLLLTIEWAVRKKYKLL
ncbi:MAG: hypothetical protein ACR2NP_10875 [Pirellulaceae bacterium]